MAVLKNKSEEKKNIFTKIFLPLYIVISMLFILYIAYSYVVGIVYKGSFIKGQEQGYVRAIQDLMSQAGAKCEPVSLTLGDKQIDVVNVACLQKQSSSINAGNEPKSTTE